MGDSTVLERDQKPAIVEMRDIEKSFGGVRALKGVDLSIRAGEIHVLLGENGACKSTMMKVLSGIIAPSAGTIVIDGVEHTAVTPAQAAAAGISIIYQELSVINELSALENLFVGRIPVRSRFGIPVVDRARMEREGRAMLDRLGLRIDLDTIVRDLPIAHRQMLEIGKSLMRHVRVLVMDEPTSSLTAVEIQRLLGLVRQLRDEGMAILFISHKFDEVRAIGERYSIARWRVAISPTTRSTAPKRRCWTSRASPPPTAGAFSTPASAFTTAKCWASRVWSVRVAPIS